MDVLAEYQLPHHVKYWRLRRGRPRGVHHGEHGRQTFIWFADQPSLGAVEVHHASRRAMDAHLVFDRATTHGIALADNTIATNCHLGHDEHRDALAARWCIGQSRKDKVDDVIGEIVLTGGNEDLGAGDRKAAIVIRRGAGAQQAEVSTAMCLGETHGASPAAFDDGLEEGVLLPGFPMMQKCFGRTVG